MSLIDRFSFLVSRSSFIALLALSSGLALAAGAPGGAAVEPPLSLTVAVPDYKLVKYGALDQIQLPDSRSLITEEGRPEMPYLVETLDYPAGYRVQQVTLKSKSAAESTAGVKLPIVILNSYLDHEPTMIEGYYPAKDFAWQANRNWDGSSQLVVSVYPFHYDPKATELSVYRNFEFEIQYIRTTVSIQDIRLGKQVYDPGATVGILTRLNNSGSPQPVSVSAAIEHAYTGDHLADVPARKLSGLGASDSLTLDWSSGSAPAGDYLAVVTVKDTTGNELDHQQTPFRIGNPHCEVDSFSAEPRQFKIGNPVKLTLELKNTGTADLSGKARFEIRGPDTTWELASDFTAFAPGQTRQFSNQWDTRNAKKSVRYDVLAYADYLGTATLPKRITVSTNAAPLAAFTVKPESAAAGQVVTFDASASKDPDGQVVDYQWDLGDGATATGKTTTHSFSLPGSYTVTLTVTDNEGATGSLSRSVLVGK
jgi:hypothetical protein